MEENGVSAILQALYQQDFELAEQLAAKALTLGLFEVAALGDLERVRACVENDDAALGSFASDGFTALHLACFFGRDEVALWLLEQGADADAKAENPSDLRPLHSAAAARRLPLVEALLKHGAAPNAQQAGGFTALHAAAKHGDAGMVGALLASGAKVGQKTALGF